MAGSLMAASSGSNIENWQIAKLDANGIIQWQKQIGEFIGGGKINAVRQTADGGYIVAGSKADDAIRYSEMAVMKLDSIGGIQWQRTYSPGGQFDGSCFVTSVGQTKDGEYIVAGYTMPMSGVNGNCWIIKLDIVGSIKWQKAYCRFDSYNKSCYPKDIQQTVDGGYVVAGYYAAGDGWNNDYNIFVIKLFADGTDEEDGKIEWQKIYAGPIVNRVGIDMAESIQQTQEGGYILSGRSNALNDILVMKIDPAGAIEWQKTYGSSQSEDNAPIVRQTGDGGFFIGGNIGNAAILKLDPSGGIEWQKSYRNNRNGSGTLYAGQPTEDGGYVLAGRFVYWGSEPSFWVQKLLSDGTLGCSDNWLIDVADPGATAVAGNLTVQDANVTVSVPNATTATLQAEAVDSTWTQKMLCSMAEVACADGLDNDGDGWVDCLDQECCSSPDCQRNAACVTVSATETLVDQTNTINAAAVSGDFASTLGCSDFTLVEIQSGSFAGKGFSIGTCQTTLEGATYAGQWKGMLYRNDQEHKIYLKGLVEGEINALVEGYLTETAAGSGSFDKYHATWQISELRGTATSAVITVDGNLLYQGSTTFPDTGLYILQDQFIVSDTGDYGVSANAVVTHVGILDPDCPYDGQGFSAIFFNSSDGAGQGWTHDTEVVNQLFDCRGVFSRPLAGVVKAGLDDTVIPPKLSLSIRRVDLALPPMPDLLLKAWGPQRVSPGQTVDIMVQYTNAGTTFANNVFVSTALPDVTEYLSNTGGGIYKWETHEVYWNLGTVPAKASGLLSAKVYFPWGLGAHSVHGSVSTYVTSSIDKGHFLQPAYEDLKTMDDFTGYQPLDVGSTQFVDPANVDAVFASDARFADLYQYAQEQGYAVPSVMEMATSRGPLTLALLKDSTDQPILLTKTDTGSLMISWSDQGIKFYDRDGGITFDFLSQSSDVWGGWTTPPNRKADHLAAVREVLDIAGEGGDEPVCPSLEQCLYNCFRTKLPYYLLKKMVDAVSDASKVGNCWDCTYNGDKLACAKCLANIKKLPVVGEIKDAISCFDDCVDDPEKHCCTQDKDTCEIWPFKWLPIKKSAEHVRCDLSTGRYVWPPETIRFPDDGCGQCVGGKIVPNSDNNGNCTWGIPDLNAPRYPDVIPPPTHLSGEPTICDPKDANSHCSEIITAGDPNIKYGPQGPASAGQTILYKIEFENEGEGIAYGVYFTDILDQDLDDTTLVIGPVKDVANDQVLAPAGTYDPGTRTITWLAGETGSNQGGYAEVSVDIRADAPRGTEIINYATVYFPSVPEETRTNAVVSLIPVEICDDQVDNDADDFIDCRDPDCFGPGCAEDCEDGADNDSDHFVDCADTDCPPCGEDCFDMDADGTTNCENDCDDTDSSIHPGALEVCDGKDNNCNGMVDEGVAIVFYRDADGDTYGSGAETTLGCQPPDGFVTDNTDCNDAAAGIHPGAEEVCSDAIDNNCNALVDEDCSSGEPSENPDGGGGGGGGCFLFSLPALLF